jgi:serine protease Do
MHRILAATVAALSLVGGAAAQATPKPSGRGLAIALELENHFAGLADKIFPSIVTVTSYLDPPAAEKKRLVGAWFLGGRKDKYPGYRKLAITSGIMMSKAGYILTCRHGLLKKNGELCDMVSVETQDQRHTICKVIGTEPTLNMAVIKLDVYSGKAPPLIVPAKLGNSALVRPGLWAIGCGDPTGPLRFYAVGNFTAVPKRDCYQEQLTATYMQAAMKVHPQAYGGPILNSRGEVVGMLCPRFPKPDVMKPLPHQGIELALPSNTFQGLYKALIEAKSFKSPWIGIAVMSRPELIRERGADAFEKLAKPRHGIYIENVFQPSPAFAKGIRPGDFLVQFGENTIRTPLDFQKFLYLAGIGAKVKLKMWSKGKEQILELDVKPRPANAKTR